jgi:hypothetical protein
MTLTFRRGAPDDYDVFDNGEIVGRIYRIRDSEAWRWTVRLQEPTGGLADALSRASDANG